MNFKDLKALLKGDLIRSSMYVTICTLVTQIISLITTAIFTRYLGTSSFGNVFSYNIILSIVSIILPLGLTACIPKGSIEFKENLEEFLSSILSLATTIFIPILILSTMFMGQLSKVLKLPPNLSLLLIIHSFFLFVFQVSLVKYTFTQNYRKYFIVNVLATTLPIFTSILFIKLLPGPNSNYFGRIYGMASVPILFGGVYLIKQFRLGKTYFNSNWWKFGLMISIPFILHSLSSILLTSSDVFIIAKYLPDCDKGLYAFAYKIGLLINTLWIAINKAWTPWFFKRMNNKEYDDIGKALPLYMMLFTMIFLVFLMIYPELSLMMSGNDFKDSFDIIPIIGLSYYYLFLYSLPSNIEFYQNKTFLISLGTIISLTINVSLNLLFIPKYGYKIAAFTTLISYMVQFVYHFIVVKVIYNYDFIVLNVFLKYIIISSLGVAFSYVVCDYFFLRCICLVILMFIGLYKYKHQFIPIFIHK